MPTACDIRAATRADVPSITSCVREAYLHYIESRAWYERSGFIENGREVVNGYRRVYYRKAVAAGTATQDVGR